MQTDPEKISDTVLDHFKKSPNYEKLREARARLVPIVKAFNPLKAGNAAFDEALAGNSLKKTLEELNQSAIAISVCFGKEGRLGRFGRVAFALDQGFSDEQYEEWEADLQSKLGQIQRMHTVLSPVLALRKKGRPSQDVELAMAQQIAELFVELELKVSAAPGSLYVAFMVVLARELEFKTLDIRDLCRSVAKGG